MNETQRQTVRRAMDTLQEALDQAEDKPLFDQLHEQFHDMRRRFKQIRDHGEKTDSLIAAVQEQEWCRAIELLDDLRQGNQR